MAECIVIGEGQKEISESAFYFNSQLENVILADSVGRIRDWAFGYCSALRRIAIHKDIHQISFTAFDGCERLERIEVDPQNPFYSDENGVLFNKDRTCLIRYPGNHPQLDYVVPETVEWIAPEAFNRCAKLRSVILPPGLLQIGAKAFAYCRRLEKISIPSGVRQIGTAAFADCYSLNTFVVEDNPCFFLADGCLACKNESGDTLMQYPLGKPDHIFSVAPNITKIHQRAFTGAGHLERFAVSVSHPAYQECDGVLFSKGERSLVQYPMLRQDPVYRVPDWVAIISDSAFKCHAALTQVILPKKLTLIQRHAFEYCHNLREVELTGTRLECIEWSAFCGCSRLEHMDLSAQKRLEICSLAFQDCVNLQNVSLPDRSNLTLGRGVFRGCLYQLI